jgi:hypothetical protein
MSDDDEPQPEFMSALVTEHFVLQSVASATISESSSRVTIYLSSLSSGLVAIGFASASHKALAALAFTVLPTVFLLGCFTIVRLIDTSVGNIVSQRRMERIRRYYATLGPGAAAYFEPDASEVSNHGVRYNRWAFLFTMASMVIVVNSVLLGATATLVGTLATSAPIGAALGIGIVVGLIALWLGLRYEHHRVTPFVLGPHAAGQVEPGEAELA